MYAPHLTPALSYHLFHHLIKWVVPISHPAAAANELEARAQGIPLDDTTWGNIRQTAVEVGLSEREFDRLALSNH